MLTERVTLVIGIVILLISRVYPLAEHSRLVKVTLSLRYVTNADPLPLSPPSRDITESFTLYSDQF